MPELPAASRAQLHALRELRTKAGRRDQGRFAVEGTTMLGEALAAGLRPEAVFATEAAGRDLPPGLGSAPVFGVAEGAMARLSDLETPPGILAVFTLPPAGLEAALADGAPAILLAGVADPGNAGTLLRTGEIFGFRSALFTSDAVDPFNPKVVRGTMGAIFRLRLAVAPAAELAAASKRFNYTLVAARRDGEPLPGFIFPERPIVAIGNERRGVAASMPGIERAVAIPQRGRGESLNAAVAGGIIFYAFAQQFEPKIFEASTFKKP